MNKKTYNKPELKTRKIELGVFGDYGNGERNAVPVPIKVVSDLDLRME